MARHERGEDVDRVLLGIVCGGAVFLLWWLWVGLMFIGIGLGVVIFLAALAGIFHSEWSRG